MKRILLSFLPFGFCFGAKAEPVDTYRLVDCIAQVEGAPTAHVGRAGERSRFQITQAVWFQHSRWPFFQASKTTPWALEEQYRVACAHVEYLKKQLKHSTAYHIACAWNGGLTATQTGKLTPATRDYAQRVTNLYNENP